MKQRQLSQLLGTVRGHSDYQTSFHSVAGTGGDIGTSADSRRTDLYRCDSVCVGQNLSSELGSVGGRAQVLVDGKEKAGRIGLAGFCVDVLCIRITGAVEQEADCAQGIESGAKAAKDGRIEPDGDSGRGGSLEAARGQQQVAAVAKQRVAVGA